jgi:hypothetical protein
MIKRLAKFDWVEIYDDAFDRQLCSQKWMTTEGLYWHAG